MRCRATTVGFRFAVRCAGVAVAVVTAATAARADAPLFLVDSTFDDALTRVYAVDPDTGAMTLRADLGTAWTPVLGLAAADATVLYLAASDGSGLDRCAGERSCILVRVVLDPGSVVPLSQEDLGPIRTGSGTVTEIVGLTFGSDGRLFADSQGSDALYVVDPDTAEAVEVGPFGLDVDGGDVTTVGDDRFLLWNNLGDQAGLYDVDPQTGAATVFELHPGLGFAGMAAVGHTSRIVGASPASDLLYELDPVAGLEGEGPLLTLDGARFDHRRGDLDSPFCEDDPACEDGDLCTADRCTPGGCRSEAVDPDDGDVCTEDSCDPSTGPVHRDLRGPDADADAVSDCADRCPDTAALQRVDADGCSVDQLCPCAGGWPNHGAYVSCVDAAVDRTGEDGERVNLAARTACGRNATPPLRSAAAPKRRR